jgi:hypothetical protein
VKDVRIAELRPAAAEEWDTAWEACDQATYFHSREWAELWQSWTNGKYRPQPQLARFEDGARAIIAASVRRGRLRIADVAELSPGGTFGGWVSADALTPGHARALASSILRLASRVRWRMNPYDPLSGGMDVPVLTMDTTQVVDLSNGFDAVIRGWDQGQRQKVGQARRGGVEVHLAEDVAGWRGYYDAYVDSLRRWGSRTTSVYPWRLFERFAALHSPRIRLWLATLEGNVIAGTLCLYSRRHVAYWHGAAMEAHIKKRPMNLLLHEAMRHACEAGMRWFDFNPSGGHESVREFKSGFGVTTLPANVVGRDGAVISFLARLRGSR